MRAAVHAFWLQKEGNRQDEYEDAFSYSDHEDSSAGFQCAVADGATETSFSGLWARILADAFVENRLDRISPETVSPLARAWHETIANLTRDRPLSWYAEEKLRSGAFSSLLGLRILPDGCWRAVCVGDSCLFQLRGSQIVAAFPFNQPEAFNNRPLLISTNPAGNGGLAAAPAEGQWQVSDTFLLMTDALAQCFLAYKRLTRRNFTRVTDQDIFTYIIGYLRRIKACKNDDVTLLRVHITA